VFQQTYTVAFSDPAVQAAVSTADAILTGDGASPSAPAQTSTSTVLQSSLVSNGPIVQSTQATGNVSVTTVDTFGPATIMVGDNQSDTFTVLAGQEDINVNTNTEYYAYQECDHHQHLPDHANLHDLGDRGGRVRHARSGIVAAPAHRSGSGRSADLAETAEGVLMKFLSSLLLAAALAQAAIAPIPADNL